MNALVNKRTRRLLGVMILALCGVVLLSQVWMRLLVEDYKQALMAHDAALAGALTGQGLDPAFVARIFTSPIDEAEVASGREALQRAGYDEGLSYHFVPEAENFYRRYALWLGITSVFIAIVLLAVIINYINHNERQLTQANQEINQFLRGGTLISLENDFEGSLSQLFTSIHEMANSLKAYGQKEQQGRIFLKETISDISHQLKTPLAALRMNIDIIQEENPASPVTRSFTQKSEAEIERMEFLIQNLLKLARLDADAVQMEKKKFNLKRYLEEILEGFTTRATHESKALTLACDEAIILEGDGNWLMEAFSNIIKNAFDHTRPGQQILIQCEETPLLVTVSVQDNGAGIHPEDLPFIFKRFYRSRFSQDRQGVGIGLSLSKSIVEKHGGSILVESETGRGTTLHLVFPRLTKM